MTFGETKISKRHWSSACTQRRPRQCHNFYPDPDKKSCLQSHLSIRAEPMSTHHVYTYTGRNAHMLTHMHKTPQNKVTCLSSAGSFIMIQSTTTFLIQHAINLRRISVSGPLCPTNFKRKNISEHLSEFQLQFDLLMCQRCSRNAPCCCSICSTSTDMCPQKLLHGSLTFSRHRHKLCLETRLIDLCSLHQAVRHGSCLCS